MEEKKEKALQAARAHFHEHGYRKASLSAIIGEVGISKPTFYNYFKNKEELFYASMLDAYTEFNYRYSTRVKTATNAMEKLEIYINTLSWLLDSYPVFRDLYKPGNDLMPKWMQSRYCRDFFREGVENMKTLLEEGAEEGIFSPRENTDECAVILYHVLCTALSTEAGACAAEDAPQRRLDIPTMVRLIGYGLLSREHAAFSGEAAADAAGGT